MASSRAQWLAPLLCLCLWSVSCLPGPFAVSLPGLTQSESNAAIDTAMDLSSEIYFSPTSGKFPGTWYEDARVLLHRSGSTLFVAFRGTNPFDFKDLSTDLNTSPVYPFAGFDGYVHEGFFNRSSVRWGLREWSNGSYSIDAESVHWWIARPEVSFVVFTGHSLGAAAAQVTALRFLEASRRHGSLLKPFASLSFGWPISASSHFQSWLSAEEHSRFLSFAVYRDPVVNGLNDIITKKGVAYEPFCDFFYVGSSLSSRVQMDMRRKGEYDRFSDPKEIMSRSQHSLNLDFAVYHNMFQYLESTRSVTSKA